LRRAWDFALLCTIALLALGAEFTPWPGHASAAAGLPIELVKSKKGGSESCCKHCTKGQPCGNSCISVRDKCHRPPGCAC
jgi:hypothetical protein